MKISNTRHWVAERLKPNVGKLSRDKSYIEITEPEYQWLSNAKLEDHVKTRSDSSHEPSTSLVELGWNKHGEICKTAYTLTIPVSKRILFCCIGCDGGLKTCYVTPIFKHRDAYKSKEGIPYLTLQHLLKK